MIKYAHVYKYFQKRIKLFTLSALILTSAIGHTEKEIYFQKRCQFIVLRLLSNNSTPLDQRLFQHLMLISFMVLSLCFFLDFRLPKASPKRSLRGLGVFSSLMRRRQELLLILIFNLSIPLTSPLPPPKKKKKSQED